MTPPEHLGPEAKAAYAQVLAIRERAIARAGGLQPYLAACAAHDAEVSRIQADTQAVAGQEARRDHEAAKRAYLQRLQAARAARYAQGEVEVVRRPGKPATREWLRAEICTAVPDFNPRPCVGMGIHALLFALDRLRERQQQGRFLESPTGFVMDQARLVMRGRVTMWMRREAALAQGYKPLPQEGA